MIAPSLGRAFFHSRPVCFPPTERRIRSASINDSCSSRDTVGRPTGPGPPDDRKGAFREIHPERRNCRPPAVGGIPSGAWRGKPGCPIPRPGWLPLRISACCWRTWSSVRPIGEFHWASRALGPRVEGPRIDAVETEAEFGVTGRAAAVSPRRAGGHDQQVSEFHRSHNEFCRHAIGHESPTISLS